jgi:catechol 2,3-dioxygenase
LLTEDDLDLAQAHFKSRGLPTRWVDVPFQGRSLHTLDVAGTPLEICATMTTKPRRIMDFELFHGACPQRIDHFQVLTNDVRPALEFYMQMGFRLSEYIVNDGTDDLRAVFLQRKGNPHDIVFVNNAGPRLHHAAFTIPEVYHLMYICDLLGRNSFGSSVEWGPGRHFGPGYARFVYLRDPDGHRIELFTNHYQTIDMEDDPIRWQASDLSIGRWGTFPPVSWQQEGSAFAGSDIRRSDNQERPAVAVHAR